MLTRRFLNLPP